MPDRDSSPAQQMWMKGSNHSHGFSRALNAIVLRPMSRELWWRDQRVSVDAKLTAGIVTRSKYGTRCKFDWRRQLTTPEARGARFIDGLSQHHLLPKYHPNTQLFSHTMGMR